MLFAKGKGQVVPIESDQEGVQVAQTESQRYHSGK